MRSTRNIEIPVTWDKLCDDTVGSVRCRHEGYRPSVRRYYSLTFTHAKKDSIEQQRAPTQEPSKQQRVSQIGETWRGTTSDKLVLTKSCVALELIMRVSRSLSADRRCDFVKIEKWKINTHRKKKKRKTRKEKTTHSNEKTAEISRSSRYKL